ncbi:thioesterase [Pseudonocardiaceae bacterium YIM PH 21723]|nr:thioesterase [Pseudonocardiaceae bacterium YIM PH 21723]
MAGAWLRPLSRGGRRAPVIVCLPPAGSGCGRFQVWQDIVGPEVALAGVQLPGREARWNETPASTVDEVACRVAAEMTESGLIDRPFLIYGQSFGGLLGYEITRRLAVPPRLMVVAACRAPRWWTPPERGLGADLDALSRTLPGDLDEDIRAQLLGALYADAELAATYRSAPSATVSCPIMAWRGQGDPIVTQEQLAGWERHTEDSFQLVTYPGGHDVPAAQAIQLRELVTACRSI